MSIKYYLGSFQNGNDPVAGKDQLFGEYTVKLGAMRKDGKIIMRQVEFGMSGDADVGTVANLDNAASQMAERIALLSEGVIFGFYKKLGKYKNDEQPTALACKQTQWGSVIMSNDPKVEDPDSVLPRPTTAKSAKIFVPWLDDETSRQDMKNTVKAGISVGGLEYGLAVSRFVDSAKTDIEVFPIDFVQGVMTKCYNTASGFELVNLDSAAGNADGWGSEANATLVAGSDDQGA